MTEYEKIKNKSYSDYLTLTRQHEVLVFLNDKTIDDNKKKAVMKQGEGGLTLLILAIIRHLDHSLIKKMVEIGGNDLVILTNKYDSNALQYAAQRGSSNDIMKTLIDEGGKDLILHKDVHGNTAMDYASAWGVSMEPIKHMVEVGGQEALMTTNNSKQVPHSNDTTYQIKMNEQKNSTKVSMDNLIRLNKLEEAESRLDDKEEVRKLLVLDPITEWNSLMLALFFVGIVSPAFHSRLLSLIRKMVQKGGKELVLVTDKQKNNALHFALFHKAPLDVIKLLVETAGQAVMTHEQNNWEYTPLHAGCKELASVEVIEYMAQKGGIEALKLTNDDGNTPLDILFDAKIASVVSDTHITALQRVWYELDPHGSRECSKKTEQNIFRWIKSIDIIDLKNNNFLKAFLNDRFVMHH
jgi:hypothetical protein